MMMSYRLKVDPKSRKAAKFISQLQKKIQSELIESGMSQQQVAEILGVDRSVINRRLKGSANLTARSIAEFAYVFNKEIVLDFLDADGPQRANHTVATSDVISLQEHERSTPTGSVAPRSHFNIERAAL